VAAAVTDVPTTVATLGKAKVTVRLTNLGDTDTPSKVAVGLYLSDNTILGSADPQIFQATTKKLHGGQSRTFTFTVKFPDVPAGSYFVIAKADPNDTLKEKSETNNTGVSSSTVAVTVPSVDLAPSFVSDLPTEVVGGDPGKVTLNIANKGTAAFNGGANITLYASADNVLDTTLDPVVKQVSGLPLKIGIGGDKNVKISFNYPLNLTDGNYQFFATVGTGNAVDTNPSNNTAITPDAVFIRRAFIDIRADSISVTSGPLRVGGRNTVEVKVTNLGNVAVRGPLGISLSATSTSLVSGVPLIKVVRDANIAPLGTQTFKINFQLPANLPSLVSFQAVVDPDQVFSESDETNNTVTTVNSYPTQ
jgi:subtilase family serine protease